MNDYLLPLLLVLLASVFQGTFGLGMKYVKPLAWEAWWLVHATVSLVIFPLAWAWVVVPHLTGVIAQAPANELVTGEWNGMRGPLKLMSPGVVVIIVATVVMAYVSTLKAEDKPVQDNISVAVPVNDVVTTEVACWINLDWRTDTPR